MFLIFQLFDSCEIKNTVISLFKDQVLPTLNSLNIKTVYEFEPEKHHTTTKGNVTFYTHTKFKQIPKSNLIDYNRFSSRSMQMAGAGSDLPATMHWRQYKFKMAPPWFIAHHILGLSINISAVRRTIISLAYHQDLFRFESNYQLQVYLIMPCRLYLL